MRARLLVIGPGAKGRGGIASVIRLHAMTDAWKLRGGEHLSTYDDRSALHKIWSALRAYLVAPLKIHRAEIVHVHLAAQTSLMRKLPIVWMARCLQRPLIVHIHAPTEETLFVKTPRSLVRYVFRAAARVVALSPSWAEMMARHVPEANVVVVPNPVVARPARQLAAHAEPVVLFVGKLDARKGYSDLLAAAQVVLELMPATQFWLAGHGEVEQARALSERLGIASSVHLPGWIEGAALDVLYSRATLLALPSYGEGVPMSVIEAMSHGVPVICTPVGGLPELVADGENGLFVQPGDVPALAAALLQLLRTPQLAATMGAAGWTTVRAYCTVEAVSARLEALYGEVLKEAAMKQAKSRIWAALLILAGACAIVVPCRAQSTGNTKSGFALVGLQSPATVAESIFVSAIGVPKGATVTYLLDGQPQSTTNQPPFRLGGTAGFSVSALTGDHTLQGVATRPDGTSNLSSPLTLHVIPSLNQRLSAAMTAYPNDSSAQAQSLAAILQQTTTPAATLSLAEVAARQAVLRMYMNWGIDPSLDAANDQSAILLAQAPQQWAPAATATPATPLSMLFSPDAPFYQAIPAVWPRVALPVGYIQRLQLNTNQQGDGIGFGEVLSSPSDPLMIVKSQWYDNIGTLNTFPFPVPQSWSQQLPATQAGDMHMIFVSLDQNAFVSSYKTSVDPQSNGPKSLYASSPTPLGTLGDRGGSVAANFAELPAMLQPGEATNPFQPIPHGLGGSVGRVWAARVFPASSRDGGVLTDPDFCTGTGFMNTGLVPYGGVIQLDPALDLTTLQLTLPARRILEAMQTYGYYVMDYGCIDIDIYTAISEEELNPFGGLWGYNRNGPGVQNEVQAVLANNILYVVAPLTKKQ